MDDQKSRIPAWAWVFLGLLALAVAFLAFSLFSGDDTGEAPATSAPAEQTTGDTPPPSGSAGKSDSNESICGLPAGDQSVPEKAPEAQWEIVNGYAVPMSEEFGPGIETDTALTCFAHNPTGALFAASRALAFFDVADFLADPAQVEFVSEEARNSAVSEAKNTSEGVPAKIKGFKIQTNSADNFVVWLAVEVEFESKNVSTFKIPMEMSWKQGDWVLTFPAYQSDATIIESLVTENFIPWSGVN